MMSLRERILSVYRGETPDVVPYTLDLSHWFYHRNHISWDLSKPHENPEYDLIDYHRKAGVGFHIANLGSFYSVGHKSDVRLEVKKDFPDGNPEITWRYVTPIGTIERKRTWEEKSYSWGIRDWGVKTERDVKILGHALSSRTYESRWGLYKTWVDCVGDGGVVYMPLGYSGMGHCLSLWMGIEGTAYAACDFPGTMHEAVDRINDNTLELVDLLASSPADIILMGDNFSSDIQPPHFFNEWSRSFYTEAIRRLHSAGKYAAVHVDGKLRGALSMLRDAGADCADAVTPGPVGGLTPEECRKEAGAGVILSGGVPPGAWLPEVSVDIFKEAVMEWLRLKKYGPRLFAGAGDQVPPGAAEERMDIMRDMVEKHGRY